jgi:xanthine dehydrogenase YagS FAD-binding subunit
MNSFELYEPTTVSEAVDTLGRLGSRGKVLAGGSDLVSGVMKDWVQGDGMPMPDALVDVTTIPQLKGITSGAGGVTIGANTTLAELIESDVLSETFPLLTEATKSVASPLIRNFATLGGNINQRPRCWFFRGREFNCLKKGGDLCYSVGGDNRYHAIIGNDQCFIVHPSDTAMALLALNAQATIAGPNGERQVAFDDYFVTPGENILKENILEENELMVNVFIPTPAPGTRQAWSKLKNRQVYDFAIISVAAAFTETGGTWNDGRLVLGGVAPVPYRATVIENQLQGMDVSSNARAAAAQIRTVARPMSMNAYKVDVAQTLVERTLLAAMA